MLSTISTSLDLASYVKMSQDLHITAVFSNLIVYHLEQHPSYPFFDAKRDANMQ